MFLEPKRIYERMYAFVCVCVCVCMKVIYLTTLLMSRL